jgi:leader peptidase (prepilin peptidase) / N-methyltransferase
MSRTAQVTASLLAVTAAMAVMALRFGLSPPLPAFCYLAAAGVTLALIDARHRRLPDALTLPSYPIALLLLGIAAAAQPGGAGYFLDAMLGMAAAGTCFAVQAIAYPAGLGWGDVKLAGLLGLYLGWLGPGALVGGLFLGYLLAAATGLALIAAGRATRKSQLPFGPFLVAGTLTVIALSSLPAPTFW